MEPTNDNTTGRPAPDSYGSIPGEEMPVAVYVSVFAAFAWVLVASWLAFARQDDAELAMAVAAVLGIVFFALPVLCTSLPNLVVRQNARTVATSCPHALKRRQVR